MAPFHVNPWHRGGAHQYAHLIDNGASGSDTVGEACQDTAASKFQKPPNVFDTKGLWSKMEKPKVAKNCLGSKKTLQTPDPSFFKALKGQI